MPRFDNEGRNGGWVLGPLVLMCDNHHDRNNRISCVCRVETVAPTSGQDGQLVNEEVGFLARKHEDYEDDDYGESDDHDSEV